MIWPGARDVLFSLKAFAAAMLAFWIACACNLSKPVWAIFTVYMLMQPISGAIRSKALFRMVGTVAGAVITLLLMALLANLPGALFLCVGFVALVGVFLSIIDQMPRGYIYSMAGLTAAVVGLPDALDPLAGFTTAITRTEEILLGIVCATVVDSVFFPHSAGTVLNARVAAWLEGAKDYALGALCDPDGAADHHRKLGGLAADAAQLDALSSHVAYDIVLNRPSPRVVRLLHTRMLLLIRLMFSAHDWIPALRSGPGGPDPIARAVTALSDWLRDLPMVSPARSAATLRAIDDLQAEQGGPLAALQGGMGLMLRDLMLGFQDCSALQRAVSGGAPLPDHLRRAAQTERLAIPYRDPVRAFLVLLPVALAFLLVVGFWTATAWEEGATAALMTLVAGTFASAAAEPAAQFMRVLVLTTAAVSVAIVYQFAVLPAVQDFPVLVLALGLFLVPAGAFIPITSGSGLILTAMTTLMLSLQPEYDARFASTLDGALGSLAGLAATAVLGRITLAPGTAWTTWHLLRVGWSDLAAIAARRWRPNQAAYALRALDRFTVLAPQLDASEQAPNLSTAALLGELRIGLNMLRLREIEAALPAPARHAIDGMLLAMARYFRARRRNAKLEPEAVHEPGAIAMAAAVAAMPAPEAQTAWLLLAGMQRSLFGATALPETSEAADAR
jgi:uncharacterized membrane protein YccC